MVSGAVASTRSRSSSRLVVVGSRSGMDTSTAGRAFGIGFVGMMLDDDTRLLHDSLNETEDNYGLECLSSLCNHISIIFSSSFVVVRETYRLVTAEHTR